MPMLVGDVVYRHPYSSPQHDSVYPCKVVYIHPLRRFYTVEFEFEYYGLVRHFRQCYYFRSRGGDPEYTSAMSGAARTEKYRKKKDRENKNRE